MRYLKSLIIVAFAFVMAAGTLFAEDSPLEIHGGGRIGIVVNSKGGSETGPPGGNNALGTMPNYGESRHMSLSFSKKVTSESGAWSKMVIGFDDNDGDADGDLWDYEFRGRDFHLEFGGLDFLPEGSVLWAGLRGYGAGWIPMMDHSFINMAGIGVGLQNIGGIFSIAYMSVDGENGIDGIGERVTHNIIANVNTAMIEVYAAVGISPAADGPDEDGLTNLYGGVVYHAPVMGLNLGVCVATNGYAKEIYSNNYDTMFKNDSEKNISGLNMSDESDYLGVRVQAWTVTDLAPGLYIAPALRYEMLICGEDTAEGIDAGDGVADGKEDTLNRIDATVRVSKALTKNIAFVPTIGFEKAWSAEEGTYGADGDMVIQGTLAVEIGLDTGYWSGQKIQLYGTYTKLDDEGDQKLSGAFNAYESLVFGCLVTFGF